MYEYRWGHTAAQIELMAVDVTFTCYKGKTLAEKMKDPNYKPSKRKIMEAQRKWEERKRRGKRFNLNKFLTGNESLPTDNKNTDTK